MEYGKLEESVKFARGQIWYVRFNDTIGGEESVGRPAVIVSAYAGVDTNTILTVVWLTKTSKSGGTNVEINSTKWRSWALCKQIVTLDKSRFMTLMCNASSEEMGKIDVALRKVLNLPMREDTDVSEYKSKNEELTNKIYELEFELEVQKRLYEKAIGKIVDCQFTKDCANGVMKTSDWVEEEVEEPTEELDLSGLQEAGFMRLQEKEEKNEVVKANINTADWKELVEKTGMPKDAAFAITGGRQRFGAYEKVEDLLALDRFGKTRMKKFGHLLEV